MDWMVAETGGDSFLCYSFGLHFVYISKHLILPETMLIIIAPLLLLMSFIVMYFRPYKTKAINMSNAFHLIILSICCLTIALWIQDYYLNARSLVIILTVCLSLPHVVMLLWVLKNVVKGCQSLKNCYKQTKHFFGKVKFLFQGFEEPFCYDNSICFINITFIIIELCEEHCVLSQLFVRCIIIIIYYYVGSKPLHKHIKWTMVGSITALYNYSLAIS